MVAGGWCSTCAHCSSVLVPLAEVCSDWKLERGQRHLQSIGQHFHMFADVFGFTFMPQGFLKVIYRGGGGECVVHRGNLINAVDVSGPE